LFSKRKEKGKLRRLSTASPPSGPNAMMGNRMAKGRRYACLNDLLKDLPESNIES